MKVTLIIHHHTIQNYMFCRSGAERVSPSTNVLTSSNCFFCPTNSPETHRLPSQRTRRRRSSHWTSPTHKHASVIIRRVDSSDVIDTLCLYEFLLLLPPDVWLDDVSIGVTVCCHDEEHPHHHPHHPAAESGLLIQVSKYSSLRLIWGSILR